MSEIYPDEQDYPALVSALQKPGAEIIAELVPKKASTLHMAIGISGEAGELLDAIKEWVLYGKPLDVENVIEELGDLFFYIQGLQNDLGLTREAIIAENMKKLNKRYSTGTYSNQQAQERADKLVE